MKFSFLDIDRIYTVHYIRKSELVLVSFKFIDSSRIYTFSNSIPFSNDKLWPTNFLGKFAKNYIEKYIKFRVFS